jgi:hypothetical protein
MLTLCNLAACILKLCILRVVKIKAAGAVNTAPAATPRLRRKRGFVLRLTICTSAHFQRSSRAHAGRVLLLAKLRNVLPARKQRPVRAAVFGEREKAGVNLAPIRAVGAIQDFLDEQQIEPLTSW